MLNMSDRDIRARTVKEFCRAYGIGRRKTYELLAEGTLAAVKAGTRTLILEESAHTWLENLQRTPLRTPNTAIEAHNGAQMRTSKRANSK